MKKLVLFFAIATVVALSACSSKTPETTAPEVETEQIEEAIENAPVEDVVVEEEAPAAE